MSIQPSEEMVSRGLTRRPRVLDDVGGSVSIEGGEVAAVEVALPVPSMPSSSGRSL